MIRLGVRLTVNGGREAVARLIVTAAAVALGVGLLLVTVAGINAVHAQDVRTAWLNTSDHNLRASTRRHRTPCGAWPASMSTATRSSSGSTSPPPVPAHRRRPGSPVSPGPGSSMPPRPSLVSFAPPPQPILPTATPVGKSARSAPPRSPLRTRSSSSSATPPPNSRRHQAPERSEASRRPPKEGPGTGTRAGSNSSWRWLPAPCCSRCSSSSPPPPAWLQHVESSDSPPCACSAPPRGRFR